ERDVAPADVHALVARRDERERHAALLLVADELLRIEELEREPQDRRHGAQRDVALLPREADAEDFLALVHALADDAEVGNGARIRARFGVGEGEAGDLEA